MKRISAFSLASLLAASFFVTGCSEDTTVEPNKTDETKITFGSNTTYKYAVHRTDAQTGQPVAGSEDTIHRTTVNTNDSFSGQSGVVTFRDSLAKMGTVTTVRTYQAANGDLYAYNFGVEFLNENPVVLTAITGGIDVGWVLVGKMNAKSNESWLAFRDTAQFTLGALSGEILTSDSGQYVKDTTITIGAKQYTAKHFRHNVIPVLPGHTSPGASIDVFVVAKAGGVAILRRYPSEITGPVLNSKIEGEVKTLTTWSGQ